MLREEIDEKYKWDLDMFKTDEEIEKVFKNIEYLTKTLPSYDGKFSNPDLFFEYFNKYNAEQLSISKLAFFVSNSLNIDSSNTKILKLSTRLNNEYNKLMKATAFVIPQIFELDDKYLKELLKDERFKNINNFINEIIKNKPHRLDQKTSEVISKLSNSFSNSSSIFDIMSDSEMPFDDAVDSNGEKHTVNNAVYLSLISSEDRKLRETAFNSLMNGYARFNKTFAELYIKDIESDVDNIKLKNFQSCLESALNEEDVPMTVYENNIKNVNKNINLLQNYVKLLAKSSNLNDFNYFDLFKKSEFDKTISIEQAKETIFNALKPLGDEYLSMVQRKFNDKSIDYMPCQNKNSGGYCSNNFDTKTMILMNWNNNYNSMSTLAHEMGHCINAEYFNSSQPMEKAGITIFAAEIASTVNEILLNQYMLNKCSNKEKKSYLNEFLNDVRSTIFRQTLFSEFEDYAHKQIEKEIPITYEELNNKYEELNKKYYGKSCILPENLKYEWSRIPHFYNAYYVYSYSTGLISAINIVNNLLSDPTYTEKYINFLKNGTNKKAVDALKEIDIDLTTDKPFNNAFNFIKTQLDEFNNILNARK